MKKTFVKSKEMTSGSEHKSRNVLVIGLDGATWELLDPWIADEKLPTFKKLIENGTKGTLWSTFPPITPVAWSSFITGKNPGNHGIFGFYKDNIIVNSHMLNEEKIWTILDQEQKHSCIIQLPLTYPPEKLNGIMISGTLLKPPNRVDFVYPPNLIEELEELKQLQHFYEKGYKRHARARVNFQIGFDEVELITKISKKLIRKQKFDFFFVLFRSTDVLQHYFWNEKEQLLKFYQYLDSQMAKIISTFIENNKEKSSNVLIVSDHGFHSTPKKIFNINSWLAKYCRFGKRNQKQQYFKRKIFILSIRLVEKLISFLKLKKIGLFTHFQKHHKSIKKYAKNQLAKADLTSISINKEMFVDSKMYTHFRDTLIDKLKSLRDKEGETVFSEVYKKEEIYFGKYLEIAPDIVFLPTRKFRINPEYTADRIFEEKAPPSHHSGHHFSARNGIMVCYGDDIKKGTKIKNAKIQDIPVTILHMLGAPLLRNMDGAVLTEMFEASSDLHKRQKEYAKSKFTPTKLKQTRKEGLSYSEKEKNEIKRKLEDLGYL